MRTTAFFVMFVAASSGSVLAQGTQDSPNRTLMLEVAARGYLVGGRMGSLAGDSAVDKLESYVWADQTLCAMGAGDDAPPNVPWTGWHFTGTVVSKTSGQMVVRVEWRRLWENGARIQNGPSGSQTLTLRSGERVELDRVVPANPGRCGTVETKLEAAVSPTAAYLIAGRGVRGGVPGGVTGGVAAGGRGGVASGVAAGGRGGGGAGVGTAAAAGAAGGRGRGGVSAGTGAGTGGGVAAGAPAGRGGGGGGGRGTGVGGAVAGGTSSGVAGGTSGGGRGGVGGGATTGAQGGVAAGRGTVTQQGSQRLQAIRTLYSTMAMAYDAELWLVHREPNGTESVQQQAIGVSGMSKDHAFPPVSVSTSKGTITLDITAKLQAFTGDPPDPSRPSSLRYVTLRRSDTVEPQQQPRLFLSISRRGRSTGQSFIDTTGTSSIVVDLPGPTDVLSFEFPPLQKAAEDLLAGHTFSLRLRLTKGK